ncbi:MAG TPA: rRNA small subunit methyltransferase 1, partial [Candidatus Cloacimonadota bacterium]|nr:rRNA small subunit methyltransferase 1 [Candidatus Cloacimonadota bacterium]
QIKAPKLISFHKFNERSREKVLFDHLNAGQDLCFVSDAGTPCISDPAQEFVAKALELGYQATALPGATALIPAFCISGFRKPAFQFLGFMPEKAKARRETLAQIAPYPHLTILYESVHRLKKTLQELLDTLGNRQVAISRELSKLHEECIRGSLAEILADYQITEKGEFVIVIEGAEVKPQEFPNPDADTLIDSHPDQPAKSLAADIALKWSVPKSTAYNYILERRNS